MSNLKVEFKSKLWDRWERSEELVGKAPNCTRQYPNLETLEDAYRFIEDCRGMPEYAQAYDKYRITNLTKG